MTALPQGWYHHQVRVLELVTEHRPLECVELGSWKGASAIALARTVRQWGGHLTCIDTWRGHAAGHWGTQAGPPDMLVECASNLVAAGVAASVRLVPALTTEAAKWWGRTRIDFLYIDADHSYESVQADLHCWWPHVRSGGLICGDDYDHPAYPGVKQAWDEFGQQLGIEFQHYRTPDAHPPNELVYGLKP